MSTELIHSPEDGLYLTKFHGGERGVCYQITIDSGARASLTGHYGQRTYIQLTRAQVERLITALVADRLGAKPEGE
jgi:hypothetical protein